VGGGVDGEEVGGEDADVGEGQHLPHKGNIVGSLPQHRFAMFWPKSVMDFKFGILGNFSLLVKRDRYKNLGRIYGTISQPEALTWGIMHNQQDVCNMRFENSKFVIKGKLEQ
jgi:hypothetical protein